MFERELDQFHLLINKKFHKLKGVERYFKFFVFLTIIPLIDLYKYFTVKKSLQKPNVSLENKNWLLVESINNYNALSFLEKYFDVLVICPKKIQEKSQMEVIELDTDIRYPLRFRKYFFLVYLFFHPKYGVNHFHAISSSFHVYDILDQQLFKFEKPQCIFTANDHNPITRAIIQICQKYAIPCFYFQHASVAEIFPKLIFKAAFLYGFYSYNIYKTIGPIKGDVHLVGNHKFDALKCLINNKSVNNYIGICTNVLDDFKNVSRLVKSLKRELPNHQLFLRPHPREDKNNFLDLKSFANISDSKLERSEEFLSKMDIIIADNSSILLEAVCMNCLAIQTPLSNNNISDYYGFVKEGVVTYCKSELEILDTIKTHYAEPNLKQRLNAQNYDSSIGSDFEFNVESKIISILSEKYGIEQSA